MSEKLNMRRIILVLLCGLILQQTQAQIPDDTNGWLYRLCKTWGYVKYFNQNKCGVHWDELLNTSITEVLAASTNSGNNSAILKFLNRAGTNASVNNPPALPDTNLLVNTEWINDPGFSQEVKSFLVLFSSHTYPDSSSCLVRRNTGLNPIAYGYIDFTQDSLSLTIDYSIESHRLVVLFYYWNLINYFFPYRNLMDQPWDSTLIEFIPLIRKSANELEFHTNFLKLVTHINDTHGFTNSAILISTLWKGSFRPKIKFERIERQCVVTKAGSVSGINPGDILIKINGIEITEIEDSLAQFIPASTPAARFRDIYSNMIRGLQNSDIVLTLRDQFNQVYTKSVIRSEDTTTWYSWIAESDVPGSYMKTACGYGYVNMGKLMEEEVPQMYNDLKSAPAIIFDIRNYPNGTIWDLAKVFFKSNFKNTIFYSAALFSGPGTADHNYYPGWYYVMDGADLLGTWSNSHPYAGKVYILVNQETQSQAEYSCQTLSFHPNAKVIGTQTAGADGDITRIRLPGPIYSYFTSLGTYYPDGYQQQRNGVKIDKVVEPTIKGIREGIDEILMAALDCFSGTDNPMVRNIPVNVYPNPVITGSVKVHLSLDQDSEITFSVMDLTGKIIEQEVQFCPAGDQILELDLNAIAPGLYILETRSRWNVATTKLVIR